MEKLSAGKDKGRRPEKKPGAKRMRNALETGNATGRNCGELFALPPR